MRAGYRQGMQTVAEPTGLVVPDLPILDVTSQGGSMPLVPKASQVAPVLDASKIRRTLSPPPRLDTDACMSVIFDPSASVSGGNDVIGLRFELVSIALAHLASRTSAHRWQVGISTFDEGSPNELALTRLDRKGLEAARRALLSSTSGGSSVLGPSLRSAEANLYRFPGPRLLVVLTDFELFDPNPHDVLVRLIDSSAQTVLAISLGNEPPDVLVRSRVRTARVIATDPPEILAQHVVEAARATASPSKGGA